MTAANPAPKKLGRPSKYKPEYCEQIIELGKQGKSIAQMAATFDVDKASIYRWAEESEDFRTALARARAHSQNWWEEAAQNNIGNKNFNAQIWLKSVASRFRDDYTEKQITEVTGANSGAIKIETTTKLDTRALDPEQREALKLALQAAVESDRK
jgi:transposase